VELVALDLKASHEAIRDQLQQANPDIATEQTSSEAFELALQELEDRLPPVSPMDDPAELSLDGAMAFLRNHSQRK
jgi:hypothetical protein